MAMVFSFARADPKLLIEMARFNSLIEAAPSNYGLTLAQSNSLNTLFEAFQSSMHACDRPVRNQTSVLTKNQARTALMNEAYSLAMIIAGSSTVSDAQMLELGIRPRAKRSARPGPDQSPLVHIVRVRGRTVTIELHTGSKRRRRPVGVMGASFFSFVGDAPPTDATGWKFEGLITKRQFEKSFDGTAATTVWVTANWYTATGQTGTACPPVSANLPATNVLPQLDKMKMAA